MSSHWLGSCVAVLALCAPYTASAVDQTPCSSESLRLCESRLRPPPARYDYVDIGAYRPTLSPLLVIDDEPLDAQTRHRFGLHRFARDTRALFGRVPLGESLSLELATATGRLEAGGARLEPAYRPRLGETTDRALWSISLNASRQLGAFGIGGRIGYLDLRDRPAGVFDSGAPVLTMPQERGVLRQTYLGVDASYGFAQNWQLHGSAVYRRDADMRLSTGLASVAGGLPHSERDEKEWAVGLRYYGWRNFALNVEFLKTSGREAFPSESLTFTGRFGF